MGRIGVQLGKSPPGTRIDRAPASSARHPAVMVRFASQQRLAFPIEYRLVKSLRSATLEVRFLCMCVRAPTFAVMVNGTWPLPQVRAPRGLSSSIFTAPAEVATMAITALPK